MTSVSRGWVKLWRDDATNAIAVLDVYTYKMWMHLYTEALHSDWRDCRPGDVRVTIRGLAAVMGEGGTRIDDATGNGRPWSVNTVRRCLNKLLDYGYITVKTTSHAAGTILHITDWEEMTKSDQEYRRQDYPPRSEEDPLGR